MDPTRQKPAIPKSLSEENLGFERQPMVNWFEPLKLVAIGARAVISALFGQYADKREIQAALKAQTKFDYSEGNEIWFDYVADLGDGWDSTYTVAKLLAEPRLSVTDSNNTVTQTERGRLLIMGGDEVYPDATRTNYRNRTVAPYRSALPWVEEQSAPHLFTLPGNHDWYDGLTSFTRLFCQERWIGGWKTQQSRSYFALQLPHRWWLFAVDIQLDADLDKPQVDYFDEVISNLQAGDNVIFAAPKPSWVIDSLSGTPKDDSIAFLEQRIFAKKAQIYINIAGDLHHYSRYANSDNSRHFITSGGGGAFLHGTHMMPEEIEVKEAEQVSTYSVDNSSIFPSREKSKQLLRDNVKFGIKNWKASLLFGIIALLACWTMQSASIAVGGNFLADLGSLPFGLSLLCDSFAVYWELIKHSPSSAFYLLLYLVALIAFCQPFPHKSKQKMLLGQLFLGSIHGFAQFFVMLGLLVVFVQINGWFGWQAGTSQHTIALIVEIVTLTSLLAGTVMGIYLYVTNYFFSYHTEAAFSSNAIADYKNFIRFHINEEGQLTVYPMGINSVEKNWRLNQSGQPGETWFVPESGKSMQAYVHLIENPIRVSRSD